MNDRTRMQRVIKWLAVGLGMLILLAVLALGAFTAVMARMPEYRAQMQAWLSERARLDIQFAELRAGWRGYGPELVFTQAVVRSADHQRVLAVAERGGVGFDLWRALRTGRLVAARFSLQGTEIKLQRRTDGSFELVGQADWPEFETDTAFKLDSLPVGEIAIRNVRLSFRDLKTGRGPWMVDNVTLDITRSAQVFDVTGHASLPVTLGKELNFSAHGEGNLNEVARLKWQVQAAGTQLDLAGWAQVMPNDWVAPAKGKGSFQFQADFLGPQPQGLNGHVDFVDVQMQLPRWSMPLPQADALQVPADDPDAVPVSTPVQPLTQNVVAAGDATLHYTHVGLDFTGARTEQGWRVQFARLQLACENSPWPAGRASLLLRFDEEQSNWRPALLQINAEQIVLENLWPLLAYLPESERNAQMRALNASGRLYNLALRYEHIEPTAAPRYGLRVEFAQLGVSPVGRMPGVSGLSGVLSATGARGQLQLDSHDMALSIPRLFRTPLPGDQVTGRINWTRTAQGVQLSSTDLAINNMDGHAQAQFTLDIPSAGSPIIDLHAVGTNLQTSAAPRYIPAGITHRRTLAWLDAAFPAGTVRQAEATLKGTLHKFPFRGDEGLFLIKAHIEDLTLDYQPGWLPATELQVDAEFRNAGMSARATAGQVNGVKLDHAEGRIKDFRDAEIDIKAQAQGDLANGLTYVQQSPVGPAIGNLFQQLSGRGELQSRVSLYFPLKDFARHKVDVDVTLKNASVSLAGVRQSAEQIKGRLHILNDAITAADLHGQFLQGEFAVAAEPVLRGRYNVVATGLAQARPLMQFLKLPAWIRLDGAARYRYSMPGYAQRDTDGIRHLYSVDSDLRGLSISLPAPVNKPAGSSRILHLDADLRGDDMLLRGSLGELRTLVRLQQEKDAWRFDRAGLRADGIAAALPAHTGLRVDGRLEELTLDDWLRLGSMSGGETTAGSTAAPHVQDILRAANVNIGRLRLSGFEWPEVRGILQATDAGWRVDVAGDQAAGQVLVPYEFASGRPLILTMDRLKLTPVAAKQEGRQQGGSTLDPRDLPALRADIKHFQYGEHDFGTLQLTGTRTVQGLQVGALQVSGESFNGNGSGNWLQTAAGQQNSLQLTLESSDVRATMQQFNYADFITGKRGKLIANLRWPGGLDENLLGRSTGTLELQIDEGQLLNVQPGAGRVLGLLSVAALPRRLGLDFRDVTDKGLAFDTIHADFTVINGDARTQNLLLRGPTAEIGIVGRMGLGARDYDQTAIVTGNVSSALPVAGVVAGGPVVGAALLLFSQIFKEPLKGVARAYYHIGGSWDDPQVERIDADVGKASLSGADSSVAP
ncbi:MAG: YhdP family protein [Steroidobacteraceae bacterium]